MGVEPDDEHTLAHTGDIFRTCIFVPGISALVSVSGGT